MNTKADDYILDQILIWTHVTGVDMIQSIITARQEVFLATKGTIRFPRIPEEKR